MTGRSFGRCLASITAITLLFVLSVVRASADTFISNLNVGNTGGISGFPQPYGQVVVNLTSSTTATITFTANETTSNAYLFAGNGAAAVNVNATSWTLSSITGTNSLPGGGFSPGPYSDGGSSNEDGFGSFNQNINSFDGFTSSANSISFTLTDTSGTWANAASVLAFNSNGFADAAHVFVCSASAANCNSNSGATATGFAAENASGIVPIGSTPEPSSVVLLGSVFIGIAAFVRRKVQRKP